MGMQNHGNMKGRTQNILWRKTSWTYVRYMEAIYERLAHYSKCPALCQQENI